MKSQKVLFPVAALLLLALGLGLGAIFAGRHTTTTPGVTSAPTKTTTPTLTLPGAHAVTKLLGNDSDPASLWVVVNKTTPLTRPDYRPSDLETLTDIPTNDQKSDDERSLRAVIVEPTRAMFAAAKTAGFDLFVASGFRSYELQKSYYDNYVATSGQAEADKFSAKPGYSEHQTGLAFDVSLASRQCYLDICFGDTDAAKWLAAHSQDYGFTLRFPNGKTDVTGYQYEPWHFRYVGKELAVALKESGLTLDDAKPYLDKVTP